jgi:hypothetical protein
MQDKSEDITGWLLYLGKKSSRQNFVGDLLGTDHMEETDYEYYPVVGINGANH